MQYMTRRTFLSLSAAAAAGLALAGCQPIQPPTPAAQEVKPAAPAAPPKLEEVSLLDAETQTKIEKVVQFVFDANHVPGMAVGIVQDGQPVYVKDFGVARIGTEQPVTPQSIFQVMQIAGLFTAAAAMQLVEQGKLELDAPVVEYLPYFKLADERYKQITTRHLLTETSGLPPSHEERPYLDWEGKTPQTDDGALQRYVRSLSDTKLAPMPLGETRAYDTTNMGYDIAGDVIAKVSGEVYEDYMQRHILEPLGMTGSTFYFEQVDPALRVAPHVMEGFDVVVSELATWSRERAPSEGLFTTLADMLRWAQTCLNRGELDGQRILQEASWDEIWKPQVHLGWGGAQDDEGLGGWFMASTRKHRVCDYWGDDVGSHCAIYLMPEDNAGAVVLGNLFTASQRTPFYAFTLASLAVQLIALS
jgi:CubicO group peptidase (beta-lactamase class C family)